MQTLGLIIPNIGPLEWGIILVIALLLFGRRLPEVGKSVGRAIVEFRKGIKNVEEEVESETRQPTRSAARPPLTSSGQDHRVSKADPAEHPEQTGGAASV